MQTVFETFCKTSTNRWFLTCGYTFFNYPKKQQKTLKIQKHGCPPAFQATQDAVESSLTTTTLTFLCPFGSAKGVSRVTDLWIIRVRPASVLRWCVCFYPRLRLRGLQRLLGVFCGGCAAELNMGCYKSTKILVHVSSRRVIEIW